MNRWRTRENHGIGVYNDHGARTAAARLARKLELLMNLLLVTGRFPERSETFIYRQAVGLANRGHEVMVAVREIGDPSLYPGPLPANLRIQELLPDHSLRTMRRAFTAATGVTRLASQAPAAARRLHALCGTHEATRGERYRMFLRHLPFVALDADIVHFEFTSIAVMYPLVRHLLGAPVVVSCRGSDIHTLDLRSGAARAATLACLTSADAVHCVSTEMADEVHRLTRREHGVWVNRPAVEADEISAPLRPRRPGPLRLIATGRLVWKKGWDYLLAALARLADRGIDFHAEILGEGELKNYVRFSIGDLGLARRVSLAGGVAPREVLARMQHADVFVLSSVTEGISNAVLEAMASGLPIVTTDVGGMREAVSDGVEGFVVPARDVSAFADRIESLARDPALRATMGRAARARAVAEFSLTRQLESFEAMYRAMHEEAA